jgi:hypothetical protein
MKQVYILELSDNKWYVGTSDNFKVRVESHMNGKGSEWTRLYKPVKCVSHKKGDEADEEITTLRLMGKYGIENVRGGSYSKIVLNDSEKQVAKQQIHSINNECYKCGDNDHKASECITDKVDFCSLCCNIEENEIYPLYGTIGKYYAGDDCYISCPGCKAD